jgi:hypothetical protein
VPGRKGARRAKAGSRGAVGWLCREEEENIEQADSREEGREVRLESREEADWLEQGGSK